MDKDRRTRVLVVEDNAMDAKLLLRYLEKSRVTMDVQVMADGQEALESLQQASSNPDAWCPEVVVLDLNMPRLGGFEVLRQIRREKQLRHIPVIILTSSVLEEDIERAHHLEADAYLNKPLEPEEFADVVQAIEEMLCSGRGREDTAED